MPGSMLLVTESSVSAAKLRGSHYQVVWLKMSAKSLFVLQMLDVARSSNASFVKLGAKSLKSGSKGRQRFGIRIFGTSTKVFVHMVARGVFPWRVSL
mmetsp:Transcript_87920/g.231622  ORF Transcript_87920/g.231622 Transcript_87920/m.231622 type:complete len:97 (-) Transcript_87920:174-464(-)